MTDYDGNPVRGIACPGCDQVSVVYNGNYFCSDRHGCGWVMDPESNEHVHIVRAYLTQLSAKAEDDNDVDEWMRLNGYLESLPESPSGTRRAARFTKLTKARS